MDEKADIEFERNSDSDLTNRASRDLVELWRSGSQEAARILLARYEVRLIALVATRLNRKFRDSIAPEDIVQSALGSFFRVTSAGVKPSIQLASAASAWNILATFTRRKLSRALERETASKRGGDWTKESFDKLKSTLPGVPSETEADEVLADVRSLLTPDQWLLLNLLLENATQKEIADQLKVDERTIRRRIVALRDVVNERLAPVDEPDGSAVDPLQGTIDLPGISYRQFVLGKLVGSGALGKVYRAGMQSDGQIVAVKFMHRNLWTNRNSRLSFLREIDLAAKIDHPGIVKYRGWGQSPHGGPYIVCEFVDGQSLTRAQPATATTSIRWLSQICEAIAAAHRVGVVHGDLTPNNVLLAHDGRIVVTDFGFAAYAYQPLGNQIPHDFMKSPGGTLGFAAPEQISPAFGSISPATDVYAIGGLAYYLLTGRSAHYKDVLLDTISDDDLQFPVFPRTTPESKLALVVKLAMKKAVDDRPQSVSELATLLAD